MAAEKCTLIPEQLFESQDEFIMHVKRYAVENGFNVRLDDVERDKEGHIRKRDIVCSSEGAPRSKDATKREGSVDQMETDGSDKATPSRAAVAHSGVHRRKSMKTGCRWLARASRQPSGMWKTIMLRLEHNHELATRYELALPTAHAIRTGDNDSISAAALAARNAVEGGFYRGPSVEFKNLFLQMTVACTDLCWAAARHPETISEVLSEIRRLNQHLDKQSAAADFSEAADARSTRGHSMLPAISEVDDVREDEAENGTENKGSAAAAAAAAATTNNGNKHNNNGDGALVMMGHSNGMVVGNHVSGNSPPQPSHFLGVSHLITQHMDVTMNESPAQILARSQNHHVEAHSPEIGSSNPTGISAAAVAAAVAAAKTTADTPISPTQTSAAGSGTASSATGAVKRSRGRPRKNPMAADAKPTKTKAQQQQQQQGAQLKPTPTPADLASLSHKIISQNAASSPANMQRPLSSALALPPQPMQVQQHAHSRAQLLGGNANANASSIIETRPHANPAQRQAHPPQPQPQQSPTFFLGAAEGNGYSERSTAAADSDAYSDVPETMGDSAYDVAQKSAASVYSAATAAASSAAGVPQYPAAAAAAASKSAAAAANAYSAANALRYSIPSPAAIAATVPPATTAATASVSRSAAISAISESSANATAAVDPEASNIDAAVAVAAAASGYGFAGRSRSNVGERNYNGQPGMPVVSSVYQPQGGYQYQQSQKLPRHGPSVSYRPHGLQQQQPLEEISSANNSAVSAAAAVVTASDSPVVGNIGHMVLSSSSSAYQSQLARMQATAASSVGEPHVQRVHAHGHPQYQHYHYHHPAQHHQQQQQHAQHAQQQHMLHFNQPMAGAHMDRGEDPASAAHFNSYMIMSRAHQQQQQQQQSQQLPPPSNEHFVAVSHQSPPIAMSALPPMTHSNSVLSTTRRLDELQLNSYATVTEFPKM
ncbi:hypothetical protein LPJ75_001336 [Coemansia sp. RSA 2598]|nr:hypothetical protein LPJ75_001336 [Coemansia sp. RSA 2598]